MSVSSSFTTVPHGERYKSITKIIGHEEDINLPSVLDTEINQLLIKQLTLTLKEVEDKLKSGFWTVEDLSRVVLDLEESND